MELQRAEALTEARKLIRTLDAAPDPLRQAQAAIAILLRAGPWRAAAQRQLVDLSGWLAARPPPTAIKARCQIVLKGLG